MGGRADDGEPWQGSPQAAQLKGVAVTGVALDRHHPRAAIPADPKELAVGGGHGHRVRVVLGGQALADALTEPVPALMDGYPAAGTSLGCRGR